MHSNSNNRQRDDNNKCSRSRDGEPTDVDASHRSMYLQVALAQTARKLEHAEKESDSPRNAVRKHQPWNYPIPLAQERVGVQECPVASDQNEHRHQTEHNPHGMLGLE